MARKIIIGIVIFFILFLLGKVTEHDKTKMVVTEEDNYVTEENSFYSVMEVSENEEFWETIKGIRGNRDAIFNMVKNKDCYQLQIWFDKAYDRVELLRRKGYRDDLRESYKEFGDYLDDTMKRIGCYD